MTHFFDQMDEQTIKTEATHKIYFEVPTDLKALGDDNFYRNVKRMYRKRNGRVDYARIYKDFPDFLVLVRLDFPEPIDEAQEQAAPNLECDREIRWLQNNEGEEHLAGIGTPVQKTL
jgi:hypothetical protein